MPKRTAELLNKFRTRLITSLIALETKGLVESVMTNTLIKFLDSKEMQEAWMWFNEAGLIKIFASQKKIKKKLQEKLLVTFSQSLSKTLEEHAKILGVDALERLSQFLSSDQFQNLLSSIDIFNFQTLDTKKIARQSASVLSEFAESKKREVSSEIRSSMDLVESISYRLLGSPHFRDVFDLLGSDSSVLEKQQDFIIQNIVALLKNPFVETLESLKERSDLSNSWLERLIRFFNSERFEEKARQLAEKIVDQRLRSLGDASDQMDFTTYQQILETFVEETISNDALFGKISEILKSQSDEGHDAEGELKEQGRLKGFVRGMGEITSRVAEETFGNEGSELIDAIVDDVPSLGMSQKLRSKVTKIVKPGMEKLRQFSEKSTVLDSDEDSFLVVEQESLKTGIENLRFPDFDTHTMTQIGIFLQSLLLDINKLRGTSPKDYLNFALDFLVSFLSSREFKEQLQYIDQHLFVNSTELLIKAKTEPQSLILHFLPAITQAMGIYKKRLGKKQGAIANILLKFLESDSFQEGLKESDLRSMGDITAFFIDSFIDASTSSEEILGVTGLAGFLSQPIQIFLASDQLKEVRKIVNESSLDQLREGGQRDLLEETLLTGLSSSLVGFLGLLRDEEGDSSHHIFVDMLVEFLGSEDLKEHLKTLVHPLVDQLIHSKETESFKLAEYKRLMVEQLISLMNDDELLKIFIDPLKRKRFSPYGTSQSEMLSKLLEIVQKNIDEHLDSDELIENVKEDLKANGLFAKVTTAIGDWAFGDKVRDKVSGVQKRLVVNKLSKKRLNLREKVRRGQRNQRKWEVEGSLDVFLSEIEENMLRVNRFLDHVDDIDRSFAKRTLREMTSSLEKVEQRYRQLSDDLDGWQQKVKDFYVEYEEEARQYEEEITRLSQEEDFLSFVKDDLLIDKYDDAVIVKLQENVSLIAEIVGKTDDEVAQIVVKKQEMETGEKHSGMSQVLVRRSINRDYTGLIKVLKQKAEKNLSKRQEDKKQTQGMLDSVRDTQKNLDEDIKQIAEFKETLQQSFAPLSDVSIKLHAYKVEQGELDKLVTDWLKYTETMLEGLDQVLSKKTGVGARFKAIFRKGGSKALRSVKKVSRYVKQELEEKQSDLLRMKKENPKKSQTLTVEEIEREIEEKLDKARAYLGKHFHGKHQASFEKLHSLLDAERPSSSSESSSEDDVTESFEEFPPRREKTRQISSS